MHWSITKKSHQGNRTTVTVLDQQKSTAFKKFLTLLGMATLMNAASEEQQISARKLEILESKDLEKKLV